MNVNYKLDFNKVYSNTFSGVDISDVQNTFKKYFENTN